MKKDGILEILLIVVGFLAQRILIAHGFSSSSSSSSSSSKKKKKKTNGVSQKIETRGKPRTLRPYIPATSFAHKSAINDGINILPAPNGKGMGAFANITISKGDVVGEYIGEILTRREVESRYWGLRKVNKHDRKWSNSRKRRDQGISGDYIFDMGNDSYIDGEDADCSSWCRFANHADPETTANACNVEARARAGSYTAERFVGAGGEPGEEERHLYFIALMDIGHGIEICYDYGEEYWDDADGFV